MNSNIEVIANNIEYIQKDIFDIKTKLEKSYVTQDQFEPIKRIVYGLVTVIGVSVVAAVMKIIFIK